MGRLIEKSIGFLQRVTDRNRIFKPQGVSHVMTNGLLISEWADGSARYIKSESIRTKAYTEFTLSKDAKSEVKSEEEMWGFTIKSVEDSVERVVLALQGPWHEMQKLLKSARVQAASASFESVASVGNPQSSWTFGRIAKWVVGGSALMFFLLVLVPVFVQVMINPSMTSRTAGMPEFQAPYPGQATQPQFAGAAPAIQPEATVAPKSPDAKATEQEMKTMASLKGKFEFGDKDGKTFYVFTDPNCPHCKRLDGTLRNLPKGYKAQIIPVAFQSGSKELASAVLCSKDSIGEWNVAINGGRPATAACAEGSRLVEENNATLTFMRLNSTPSIISPNGLLYAGSLSPEQLAKVLAN